MNGFVKFIIWGRDESYVVTGRENTTSTAVEEIRSRGKEIGEETVLWASVDVHNDTTLERRA